MWVNQEDFKFSDNLKDLETLYAYVWMTMDFIVEQEDYNKKKLCRAVLENRYYSRIVLHKKWSFPLRISSVDVTKSARNCRFGRIYWRNP